MSNTYSTFLLKACPFGADQTSDNQMSTSENAETPKPPEEGKPTPPVENPPVVKATVPEEGAVGGEPRDRQGARRLRKKSSNSGGSKEENESAGGEAKNKGMKQRQSSTNSASNKRRMTKGSSTSINSNGDGCDYDDEFSLEEPFTDSEEESRPSAPRKLNLPIPRGRIRTLSGTVPVVGYSPKWGGATMCFSCLQFFDLPNMLADFTSHILKEHHIVVTEFDLIVDPKRYVEYWRQRFANEGGIEKFFPKTVPKEGEELFGVTDFYYTVSESLQEDYLLRQRLAMRRLEEALACQQREREDTTFSQQCIFCRYVARGNRSKIIHHLYMIHHLNLGSPDNLVFVNEYVEHLKEKLSRNECIYCEKLFSDRNTLMDHMRKRQHREVNPKNNYYDKFYIINYLELGKRWLDVLAEDFEDTMPTFVDSDEEEEEDSWHEWQEDNLDEDQQRVVCLFCDESFDAADVLLAHSIDKHGIDVIELMNDKLKLDIYGRVKLINYIRKQTYNAICFACGKDDLGSWQALRKHQVDGDHLAKTVPDRSLWDTEENLVPMFGNDHLLWMLESHLDAIASKSGGGAENGVPTDASTKVTKSRLCAQMSLDPIGDAEAATVDGVIAEDLPDLMDSALIDKELLESLK